MRRAICWIRRDLRLCDHAALAAATNQADETAVVFVFDRIILDALVDRDDRRLTFICESLREVDAGLRQHGSRLVVLHGDPIVQIPELARQLEADAVFTARDYEPYARERDERVASQVRLHPVKDAIVLDPEEVKNKSDEPFKVFSPFMRCWRSLMQPERDLAEHQPVLSRLMPDPGDLGIPLDLGRVGFTGSELWLQPGEAAAQKRLKAFANKIPKYAETRNYPADEGTSGLSVHLRFGTVSIRECFRAALASPDPDKWTAELIWREFYQHILWHFPQVVEMPFQAQYGRLEYPGTDDHFEAWCEGRTGYPIVDAAMRCLNETGFMHNRLRMVVASFLTKDLLVDYRKGEAYFARKLLDFELASNNGGWQWAASTGVDPQPWFRIFNPVLQSRKFDPDGAFIRRYVPELASLGDAAVHAPWEASEFDLLAAEVELGKTYPHPIVKHDEQRRLALQLLESANSR